MFRRSSSSGVPVVFRDCLCESSVFPKLCGKHNLGNGTLSRCGCRARAPRDPLAPATGGEPFRRLVWGWNRESASFTLDSAYDYGHDPSCELKPKVCSAFKGASQEWSCQVPVPPPPLAPLYDCHGRGGEFLDLGLDFPQCSACAHIDHPSVCVVCWFCLFFVFVCFVLVLCFSFCVFLVCSFSVCVLSVACVFVVFCVWCFC